MHELLHSDPPSITPPAGSLREIEETLLVRGMTTDQIQGLKKRLLETHITEQNAQRMIGGSFKIMGAALRYMAENDIGAEISRLVTIFADRYHRFIERNEPLLVANLFSEDLKKKLDYLPPEEIEYILARCIHTANQLSDPENAKLFYKKVMEIFDQWTHDKPEAGNISAYTFHEKLHQLFDYLTNSVDARKKPIFKDDNMITIWNNLAWFTLEIQRAAEKGRQIEPMQEIAAAVKKHDIPGIKDAFIKTAKHRPPGIIIGFDEIYDMVMDILEEDKPN